MNPNELLTLVEKKYTCKLWHNYGRYRLYFKDVAGVVIFLELDVINNKVIRVIPKWTSKHRYDMGEEIIIDYSISHRKHIKKIASEVKHLVDTNNLNTIKERIIIKPRKKK